MIIVSPRILSRKIQSWLTLLHWLHYGFHYAIGVPTFFAVGCSRVILQLEGLILTYPFGHELCKEEHRNDSSPLSSSWFSISNWAVIYLLSFFTQSGPSAFMSQYQKILSFHVSHCLKITQNVAFEFWHLPPIFVLLKLTCLVTLFDRKLQFFKNSPNWTIFGIFNQPENDEKFAELKNVF